MIDKSNEDLTVEFSVNDNGGGGTYQRNGGEPNTNVFQKAPANYKELFSDLKNLRVDQSYTQTIGVKELTRVQVRKPSAEWFFKCHPDHKAFDVLIFQFKDDKDDKDSYLVLPNLYPLLENERTVVRPKLLRGCITRQGHYFIWPLNLPGTTGTDNDWNRSARDAGHLAEKKWIRIVSGTGQYEVRSIPAGNFTEPEWPESSFNDLMLAAFKDKIIDTPDHVVLQKYWGTL